MAGIFTDVYRIVKPNSPKAGYTYADPDDMKLYSNVSWYTKVMKGASSRFSKYQQYKSMDFDVFVARALDTIAEEMCQIDVKTNLPFEIIYQNEATSEVPEHIVSTVRAALRHWCHIQGFSNNLFDIARKTIKDGDCFFTKVSDFKKWKHIEPQDVIGVSIGKETQDIDYYQLRSSNKNVNGAYGDMELSPSAGVIHFSLSSNMGGELGPFGESVLAPAIKAYRHLSLLEDAVIIYRIVRAPERRVFTIDVGNMPPQRARAYLESIKNDMRQKRVPNDMGGSDKVDSVYNPVSMNEDFFFTQTADGRGSKVDTLPGGENLGIVTDLFYFQKKFLEGLRIPSSYMSGAADGGSIVQDGKVGVAYIEELRFANYVARLQSKLNPTFDNQFKAYLKSAGINVSHDLFQIKLNDPQNFKIYKQAEVDEKLISNFNSIKDVKSISKRYALMHYLGWTEDDLQTNEAMLKQELAIPEGGIADRLNELRMMYDDKWIEGKPDIKVDDSYEDFTAQTKKVEPKEENPPEEETESSGSEDMEQPEGGETEPPEKVEEPVKPEEGSEETKEEPTPDLKDIESDIKGKE
jgi:hypothetical protein